jgi:hypothetical protein
VFFEAIQTLFNRPRLNARSHVGVLGQSYTTSLWIQRLIAAFPDLKIEWLRAPTDVLFSTQKPFLALVPDHGTPLADVWLFFSQGRRVLLKDFVANGDLRHKVAPSIRQKLEALTTANDLTPILFKRDSHFSKSLQPDFKWVFQQPQSHSSSRLPGLVPVGLALEKIQSQLQGSGVVQHPHLEHAVAVEFESHSRVTVLRNAPFGAIEMDHLVWTSPGTAIKSSETSLRHSRVSSPYHWESHGAWVSSHLVTALPECSVWVCDSSAEKFWNTGLLQSGTLKRVHCIDGRRWGRDSQKYWLQIDVLNITASTEDAEAPAERVEKFLYESCPELERALPTFESHILEENRLLAEPRGYEQRVHPLIDLWCAGSLGPVDRHVDMWITKNIVRDKIKAPAQPAAGS